VKKTSCREPTGDFFCTIFSHAFYRRTGASLPPPRKPLEWSRTDQKHRADRLGCRRHRPLRTVEFFLRQKPEDASGRVRTVLHATRAAGRADPRRADPGPFPPGREPGRDAERQLVDPPTGADGERTRVEAGLKARYCEIFKSGFLADFDKRMVERMTRFTAATPPDRIGHHAMHLTRRINLLRHRMESGEFESLSALPAAAYASALLEVQTIDEISDKLSELYLYYLLWRADDRLLNSELKDLQTWLKHILTSSGARLNWLVDWVNINGDAPAVTLATFWNDLGPDENEIVVAPAFTEQGKAAVDDYIREIESALFEPLVIGSQKLDFQDAYREMYLDAWKDFVDYFPKGLARLPDRDRWKQAGMRMPTKKGPHLALLDTMAAELAAYKDVDGLPGWVDLVHRFKSVSLQAKAAGREGDPEPGILKKASQAVSSKLGRLEQATGVNVTDALNFEAQMEAGKAYNQYRDALTELVPIVDSRKAAFKVASTLYSEDPAEGESAFSKARRGQRRLRTVLGGATGDTERFLGSCQRTNSVLSYVCRP
jgi:hypothetical protein